MSNGAIIRVFNALRISAAKKKMPPPLPLVAADLADAVTRAAAEADITAEALISECVGQHWETALRHRVLIQRQSDVDEALLELARLVGRLSAGPSEPPANICRYRPADAE